MYSLVLLSRAYICTDMPEYAILSFFFFIYQAFFLSFFAL
jgi:hypothetical protein